MQFEFESVNESYKNLISEIIKNGAQVSPRGLDTLEISPAVITIKNPYDNVIISDSRKLNYGFMLGELAWILQKSNDMNHICHYNKNWSNFSDDGETLNGAYGQRIFAYGEHEVNQFEEVFKLLSEDKNSRQGTIVLFDPNKDFKKTKDKPCTNLIRFSIREDKLNMTVFMRSNDIMFGYPYDVFNFTNLQFIMAAKLGVGVGKYTHIVDSLHLYTEQLDWAKSIVFEPHKSIKNTFCSMGKIPFEGDVQTFLNVEQTTRKLGDKLNVNHVIKMIQNIYSYNWKSYAAFIALYNYRKMKKDDVFLSRFRSLITNEFKNILSRYQALK